MKPMMECGHQANGYSGDKHVCVICFPSDESKTEAGPPNLEGREARCLCGKLRPSTEALAGHLAFFQYRGEDSKDAMQSCKNCSYFDVAHTEEVRSKPGNSDRICDNFEARGAWEYDSFYCGCRGWD